MEKFAKGNSMITINNLIPNRPVVTMSLILKKKEIKTRDSRI